MRGRSTRSVTVAERGVACQNIQLNCRLNLEGEAVEADFLGFQEG